MSFGLALVYPLLGLLLAKYNSTYMTVRTIDYLTIENAIFAHHIRRTASKFKHSRILDPWKGSRALFLGNGPHPLD